MALEPHRVKRVAACASQGRCPGPGGRPVQDGPKTPSPVRDALKLGDHDPDLYRRELLADHPRARFGQIDGLIVDARRLPAHDRDAAYRKGLIPDPALLGEVDQ